MRFHIISMAVAFMILCGCTSERPTAFRQEETPIPGTPGGNDGYYGMLYVSDGQELRTGHELEMDDNDVNACLVDRGGILMLENIQIMKSGDATGMVVSGGGHAACAVRNGGKLYFNGKGSIFTDGYGAHGIYGEGKQTRIEAEDLELETRGDTSAGIFLIHGAHAVLKNGSVTTRSENAPCVLISENSELDGERVSMASPETVIEVLGGVPKIRLVNSQIEGNISINEEAGLNLNLTGTKWHGAIPFGSESSLNLTMDAESFWKLTDDVSLSTFQDLDQDLNNIDSDGYIIYYDYDNPGNAWIGGQTLPLLGGGFLTPEI